jgi:hypothetical protein
MPLMRWPAWSRSLPRGGDGGERLSCRRFSPCGRGFDGGAQDLACLMLIQASEAHHCSETRFLQREVAMFWLLLPLDARAERHLGDRTRQSPHSFWAHLLQSVWNGLRGRH